MPESRTEMRCATVDCRGSLGAAIGGRYLPAGHLYPGRDWWVDDHGQTLVRCRLCNTWYRVACRKGRVGLIADTLLYSA